MEIREIFSNMYTLIVDTFSLNVVLIFLEIYVQKLQFLDLPGKPFSDIIFPDWPKITHLSGNKNSLIFPDWKKELIFQC